MCCNEASKPWALLIFWCQIVACDKVQLSHFPCSLCQMARTAWWEAGIWHNITTKVNISMIVFRIKILITTRWSNQHLNKKSPHQMDMLHIRRLPRYTKMNRTSLWQFVFANKLSPRRFIKDLKKCLMLMLNSILIVKIDFRLPKHFVESFPFLYPDLHLQTGILLRIKQLAFKSLHE